MSTVDDFWRLARERDMVPVPRAKVIVNPAAGAGAARRKWPRIEQLLRGVGLTFDHEFTQCAGQAMDLAKAAVALGYELVVVVGGDGTINEVVNGLVMPGGAGSQVELGVINIGTANDFACSLALPRGLEEACRLLTSSRRAWVDVGVVECICQGEPRQRFFVNVAGSGFDAAMVQAARLPRSSLAPKLPYAVAFIKTVAAYSLKEISLKLDGKEEKRSALMVLVSNGKFVGTLPVAPDADMGDGLVEVTVFELPTMLKMLRALPKSYLKLSVSPSEVHYTRASFVQLESPQRLPVEADGELLGELPARIWVLPRALRVIA